MTTIYQFPLWKDCPWASRLPKNLAVRRGKYLGRDMIMVDNSPQFKGQHFRGHEWEKNNIVHVSWSGGEDLTPPLAKLIEKTFGVKVGALAPAV